MKINRSKRQYWIRLLGMTLFALTVAIAGIFVGMSYQNALHYMHPARQIASGESLKANGIEFQEVEFTTEDNVKISAWYTPPQNGTVILVAHGYGDKRPEDFYELFASHGYGIVGWDFRAHGKSGGGFSSLGYYEVLDVKAALDFALAQPGVEHVGAWGGSMGAVTMIRATAQYPEIEALVADSPFVTLEEEMELIVPYTLMRSLMKFFVRRETGLTLDLVRPIDDISRISPRPVFIIQGMGDRNIPSDSAQRLYDAAGDPRMIWLEADVPHLSMYSYYRDKYIKRVIGFFDNYLLK